MQRCTYLILPSLIRSFPPVPCAPANPQASYTCNSNVVVFSWQPTNNALYYVATSVDSNGMSTECRTTDIMCYFTDAECAQNYTYRVYAVTLQCNTDITEPVIVQTCEYFLVFVVTFLKCDYRSFLWLVALTTGKVQLFFKHFELKERNEIHILLHFLSLAPCLPTNLRRKAECDPNRLVINWDSAAGALSYFVEAKGNTKESYNCTTSSSSCEITNVPCGEHLSVWIVASNSKCSSPQVLGEVAQTGMY